MLLKVNTEYQILLLVTDINGNRITGDLPTVKIKDIQNNTYWNGVAWQSTPAMIYMEHVANGVYNSFFTPEAVGIYEITSQSEVYNITKIELLEVYDSDIAKYDWKTGSPFTISYTRLSGTDVPTVSICKTASETYWSGTAWVTDKISLSMTALAGGVFTKIFTPNEDGAYSVIIDLTTGTDSVFEINATSQADNIPPVKITNFTFKSQDGTDSTVKNEQGAPMNGVIITCYDSATKESICKAATNLNGEWNMLLQPGKYLFVFSKDGYMSVSFERTVV